MDTQNASAERIGEIRNEQQRYFESGDTLI